MGKITYLGTQGCPGTIALGINYQITSEECKSFEQYDCDTFAKAFKCFINIEHKCFYIQCADYAVYGILYSVDGVHLMVAIHICLQKAIILLRKWKLSSLIMLF